jgi:hypothetical protein
MLVYVPNQSNNESQNANLMYRVPELTTLEPILHFIHLNEESVRRCIKLSKPGALYHPPRSPFSPTPVGD